MRPPSRLALVPLVLPLACAAPSHAPLPEPEADSGIVLGETLRLDSRIMGEERELLVFLPESYATSNARYPVLYLLDAEGDFVHTAGIVEFLGGIDRTPELILVGIVNTNRSRDLTPPSTNEDETAFWDEVGGADRFRRFLREELIPLIDERYRTAPYRIVCGCSFGGLLAIHDYMSASPVFDAALTSSPAVGWNHRELVQAAPAFFSGGAPRPLYVASAGKDFPANLANIRELARIVDASTAAPEDWKHDAFDAEGHYSLHHRSIYRGLEFLYAAWPVPDEVAASADFAAYERHFARLSERFGYTIPIPMRSIVRVGNQLLREQQFEKGIAVFERARDLYSDSPEAHWRVGEAYRLAGDIDVARTHFEDAYRLAAEQEAPDLADYAETLESLDD